MLRSAVVFVVLSVAFASAVPDQDKGHKACVYEGIVLQPGESGPSKTTCSEYFCHDDGTLSGKTCPSVAAPVSCKRIEHKDVTLHPFPDCCPTFEC